MSRTAKSDVYWKNLFQRSICWGEGALTGRDYGRCTTEGGVRGKPEIALPALTMVQWKVSEEDLGKFTVNTIEELEFNDCCANIIRNIKENQKSIN